MKEHHSGSSLRQHRLRDLFLPSNLVLLLYMFISVITLAILNITGLWQLFLGEPVTIADVAPLTDEFSAFQDRLSTPIVMVFWLFIGAAAYTAIWLAENVFFIAKTEVEQSQYVYGNPAAQRWYWESAIASNVLLIITVLLWISFIALYFRLLLPAFSDLFHDSLFSAPIYQRVFNSIVAIVGNAAAIYIILLMSRAITYLWRANRP